MNNNRWAVDKKEQCDEQSVAESSRTPISAPPAIPHSQQVSSATGGCNLPRLPLCAGGGDLPCLSPCPATTSGAPHGEPNASLPTRRPQPPMPRFVPSDDLPHPTSGGPSWRHCRSLLHHPGVAAVTPSLRELVLARIPFLRDPPPPPLPSVRCHRH